MRHFETDYTLEYLEKSSNRWRLALAVERLNEFCDTDPRHPYYDIKLHRGGSIFLSLRTQRIPQTTKKFFGKSRFEVTIAAAEYVKSGKF